MAPTPAKALEGFTLLQQDKTAVVVGATQGIGAGIARRLAKLGCSRIITLGRNEKRGLEVVELLKKLSPDGQNLDARFIKGDLSNVNSTQAAADAIEAALGSAKIDYLFQCQNGTPTGSVEASELNEDGIHRPFFTQCISRFIIAYRLTTHGCLVKDATVLTVANTGQTLDDLKVEDLSLIAKKEAGRGKIGLFMDQSKRDSCVLDSFTEEFQAKYPDYRFLHMWPGLVKTEDFDYNAFPFPLSIVGWILMQIIGQSADAFAHAPVYVAVKPSSDKLSIGSERYFAYTAKPSKIGAWAQKPENRSALWKKLLEIAGESQT